MRRFTNMGHHEGRQRFPQSPNEKKVVSGPIPDFGSFLPEFAGTLLGFDDYVSQYLMAFLQRRQGMIFANGSGIDMVLEDVTEL